MSIIRKWPIARVEYIDTNLVSWIAESRAGTGTWVIREDGDANGPKDDGSVTREFPPTPICGLMCDFDEEGTMLLVMTAEQRAWLGMSDAVYQKLNVELRLSYQRYEKTGKLED